MMKAKEHKKTKCSKLSAK